MLLQHLTPLRTSLKNSLHAVAAYPSSTCARLITTIIILWLRSAVPIRSTYGGKFTGRTLKICLSQQSRLLVIADCSASDWWWWFGQAVIAVTRSRWRSTMVWNVIWSDNAKHRMTTICSILLRKINNN